MTAVLGTRREFVDVLRQLDAGTLRPVVGRVFPLSRAREAVAHLADRAQFGKIVVVPDARYSGSPAGWCNFRLRRTACCSHSCFCPTKARTLV
jgi:hypothetical protein